MKIISQLRFRRGIEPIETIFMNIKSILSSALGQERTRKTKPNSFVLIVCMLKQN
jgi:hypothetical protein